MKKLYVLLALLTILLCSCLPSDFFTSNITTSEITIPEITTPHEVTSSQETTSPQETTLPQETTSPQETTTKETAPEQTTPAETVHKHVYDQNVVITNATCISPGSWQGMCACGEWQKISLEDTAEHSWGEAVISKEATCTESGEAVATCTTCGTTQKSTVPATGIHVYLNAKCIGCGTSPISTYSMPSSYDADGDGEKDVYNFSPTLLEGYQNGVHVWAGDYDTELSVSPGKSSAQGYDHWYITENSGNYLVYKVTVPESGTYEMILHLRLKDAQVRGTKYTVNGGTDHEQMIETSYGYADMDYSSMRNGTHGIYMYGVTVNLVAGENTVKIEHAASCPKSQHYRDFYFVKVGDYHAHEYTEETVIKEPTCSKNGEKKLACACGDSKTVAIPATREHVYQDNVCAVCGAVYTPVGITNYDFLSDKPGFAGGTLTFLPETTDVYTFYWADEVGRLKDYTMLCSGTFAANTETEIIIQSFTAIPEGAVRLIAVSGDGKIVYSYTIPTSRLLVAEELYVFGALSDTHQGTRYGETSIPYNHFVNASKVLYEKGAIAIGICGDFSYDNLESEYILHSNAIKEIYEVAPDMPIFTTTGNHESKYTGFSYDWYMQYARNVVDYDSELDYIFSDGNSLDYVVELPDGSVMIFLHQIYYDYGKSTSRLLDDNQLDWLGARLEEYKDRTVFLFFHSFMDEEVGDATNTSGNEYSLPLISSTVEYKRFDEYFQQYTNVVFFSGHSHWAFDSQLVEPKPGKTNYDKNIDDKDGTYATMVHIPACSTPRVLTGSGSGRSEGYIVHVYEDCIVLEGYEFAKGETFAYATYIIEK